MAVDAGVGRGNSSAVRLHLLAAGGRSTTVYGVMETLVDPPSRHAGEMSAERPSSGIAGGRSTIVDE